MSSLRFAHPLLLLLLLLIPLVSWWELSTRRQSKATLRFSATSLFMNLKAGQGSWRFKIPLFLRGIALALVVVALARPQNVDTRSQTSADVTDIMICLDASQSMTSVDFQPKNRFDVAKEVAKNFIVGRQFDRIGLVVFGRISMTQCPLTLDYGALLTALNAVEIGTVPSDRTAIGDATLTAANRLKESAAKSKIIILVTDGSNNSGMIDPETAAKAAAAFGVRIYTIGAGVPGQGRIPVDDPVFGKRLVPIEDDLDEGTLQRIALATGGRYFRATSREALDSIFKQIDRMEKTQIQVKEFSDFDELFRPFALLALLFLAGENLMTLTLARVLP